MKTITIEIKQERVKIISPSWKAYMMGMNEIIPEILYCDEIYESDEQVEKLLIEAQKIYDKKNYRLSWIKEPEIRIYWKTLKKFEGELKE